MTNNIIIRAWLESLRLKTLPLALMSIINGSVLAYWQHHFNLSIAILSLITAILLQILSNLANDYGDMAKGTDTSERIGPQRGMQKGLITRAQMKSALGLVIVLTMMAGICLLVVACDSWQDFIGFLVLGLLSIIAAITYTVGEKPYGYLGLGDISVFIFFGLLGVLGTFYLQTKALFPFLLLPAIGCGLLSVAVLNINNLRDINTDKQNNKNTLAVRFGPLAGRYYHCGLLIVAMLCFSCFSSIYLRTWSGWLFLLLVPLYIRHSYYMLTHLQAKQVVGELVNMVKLAILTNLLFALGVWLSTF